MKVQNMTPIVKRYIFKVQRYSETFCALMSSYSKDFTNL